MKFTDEGVALIKKFEGCRLIAYPDPATGRAPWSIGYGSTQDVLPGMRISQEEAEARLLRDVDEVSAAVRSALKHPLTDSQFTAAVCFAYNVKSWRMRPLFRYLSEGDLTSAKAHWLLYDKANGAEMEGLKARREAELELFLAP